MPHIPVHPSAIKRKRQNLKRRERNHDAKSRARTVVKQAADAISGSDATAAQEKLREATRTLYKVASRGQMHRNTVRRQIARLAARFHKTHGSAAQTKA